MAPLHKKIRHHLQTKKSSYLSAGIVLSVFLLVTVTFFATRGENPAVSELAFTEYSVAGKDAGSVIPASCESPYNYEHTAGECADVWWCDGVTLGNDWCTTECCTKSDGTSQCGTRNCAVVTCTDQGSHTRVTYDPGSSCQGTITSYSLFTCSDGTSEERYPSSYTFNDCVAPTCANGGLSGPVDCPTCENGGLNVDKCWCDAVGADGLAQFYTDQCCTGYNGTKCGTTVRTCANGGLSGPVSCPDCANGGLSGEVCCLSPNVWYNSSCQAPSCANGGLSGPVSCPDCANGGLSGEVCCSAPNVWYNSSCQAPSCANGGLSGPVSCPTCANGGLNATMCACDASNLNGSFTDECCTGYSGQKCGNVTRSCANGGLSGQVCCDFPNVWTGASCVASACGTYANGVPQLSEPSSNPYACNPGIYSNSPSDTSQDWNWTCGNTSCSAPKYGCRITTDSNYSLPQYGASGPNNNWGCASTCASGATDYPTCTTCPAGQGMVSGMCTILPVISNSSLIYPFISFVCTNSTSYSIIRNEGGFSQSGPAANGATITAQIYGDGEGNYTLECQNGSLFDSAVVNYTIPVLTSNGMTLTASPRTVNNNKNTTISWAVLNPRPTCSLRAEVVCASAVCTAAEIAASSSLNTTLRTGTTDINDPYGAGRNIQTAVKTIYTQYSNKAIGKKTLLMSNTTDFILDCGSSLIKKMRVVVSDENEG